MGEKFFYKRNLPHYQPLNAVYFVTYRLSNSLPVKKINELKKKFTDEIAEIKKYKPGKLIKNEIVELRKKYFGKFDKLLDCSTYGPQWLKNDKIARITANSLHYYAGNEYKLITYSIMPNHVHVVLSISDVTRISDSSNRNGVSIYRLTNILQSIKKYSARESNKILKRQGQFWHHESYDHVVRDEKELERIIGYVLNNPVKAGLVENWYDWKWNYLKSD